MFLQTVKSNWKGYNSLTLTEGNKKGKALVLRTFPLW